jgi:hypothetical protein
VINLIVTYENTLFNIGCSGKHNIDIVPVHMVLSQNCIKYPFTEITPVEIIDDFLLNRQEK